MFGDVCIMQVIKFDCVYFIQIGQCIVFFCQVVYGFDWFDIVIYGVDIFEGDNFGCIDWSCFEQFFQVFNVIVMLDVFFVVCVFYIFDY